MGSRQGQRQPQVGATFYPGGVDDFYMPEVISPSPQRVMPEVPEQIQGNLAHLELEASPVNRFSGLQSPAPEMQAFPSRNSSLITTTSSDQHQSYGHSAQDQPSFSPFPPLHNRPANVPPSDDEREIILDNARTPVLNSNDPEMQLTWAQDALAYAEIASQNELRISQNRATRPQTPRTEHQLRVDAINVVSFLADQHHPQAEFMKGMWLEFGKFGFRLDKKEAYRCYARAAQAGYARAEYRMGMQFESSNDPAKAIKHYSIGVEAGDSASHYRLGMMTLLGQHGQPLDYARGVQLIKFAAETSDENAPQGAYVFGMLQAREITQINVSERYLPLNINAARFNIEKAAYLGFAKAQTRMGAAYELCQLGCDFDPALSLHYNALAARQGEPEAEMAISKWFLCGYEGLFEKNEELAFEYAQRASQSGLATAEFALGYFYEIGIYVPVNLKEARLWYGKASEHGNKDAAARIDSISRSKTLSKKDHENIAIHKIQSQRGKRPERFTTPATPMPTIADDTVDMPEPYADSRRYPGGAPQRPPSAVPYPTDDGVGPRPRPGNVSGYPNQNPRLSSDPRSNYIVNTGNAPQDSKYRGSSGASMRPTPQIYPSVDNAGASRGRGMPAHNNASVLPVPPTYRKPTSGFSSPQRMASPDGYRLQAPGVDIGFSAPQDPSGADRRRRMQLSDNQAGGGGGPPNRPMAGQHSYSATSSDRISSRQSNLPHSQTFSGSNSNPSAPNPQNPRPSIASNPASRPGSAVPSPGLPPKIPPQERPAATPPPSSTTAVGAKTPGKGPKTFEEMGVPHTKKDSECVVM